MRHAHLFSLLVFVGPALLDATAPRAAIGPTSPVALDSSPIRPRRQIPDDPLAGLPTDDDGRPGRGKSPPGKNPTCAIDARPADPRDIGDLRAAVAFAQHGPRSWSCPPRTTAGNVGLRIAVDGTGKITAAEPTQNGSDLATAIAKRLAGKSIAPRRAGPTTGSVLLTFTPVKVR